MTWLKKPPHPSKIVSLNDTISVKIIEIEKDKKKISCSLKQTKTNPWDKLNETIKINDILETEVVNIVDFGIFVKVHDEIDGMVHVSDLSWDEKICQQTLEQFKKGDKLKVKILEINVEKERISLGIKQLESDPVQEFLDKNPLKSVVSGKIIEIDDKFLKIDLGNNIFGTIKRSNLSKDKNEQKVDRFALEEQVDSVIISVDHKTRTLNLSIKEIEINDEKEALSKYGSSDSGASLGDILGSILKKKE
jgi:small subunit ribosomal protein S1